MMRPLCQQCPPHLNRLATRHVGVARGDDDMPTYPRWLCDGCAAGLEDYVPPGPIYVAAGGEGDPLPRYSTGADYLLMEDELCARGRGEEYAACLQLVVFGCRPAVLTDYHVSRLLRATPEQRCKAALLTVMAGAE